MKDMLKDHVAIFLAAFIITAFLVFGLYALRGEARALPDVYVAVADTDEVGERPCVWHPRYGWMCRDLSDD